MYAISPLSTVLGISAILAIIYYDLRALKVLSKIIHSKMHRPAIKSPRNFLIVMISLIFCIAPYVYLYYTLSGFDVVTVSQKIVSQTVQESNVQGVIFNQIPLATKSNGMTIISLPLLVSLYSISVGIILDLGVAFFVTIGVYMTAPLSIFKKRMLISRAKQKMKKLSGMKVVAVTGSYGKTTTKEIIEHLVSKKFNTIKTEKHNNTDVGIAKTILEQANSKTEVFIAEMGAYKLGETADCARIAPPDIAIITGIDEQHISLYGSFKNIIDSTMEIVDELKPDGVVVINGNNEYCQKIAQKITDKNKVLYYVEEFPDTKSEKTPILDFPNDGNCYIPLVKETTRGLEFKVAYKGEVETINTAIKAKYNAGNIAAAVVTSAELGQSLKDVAEILNKDDFDLPYLNIKNGINKSQIIDDGYNINPSGYFAGLKFLNSQPATGKKWVVTQGFIELGDERDNTYKKVASETVKYADGIITNDLDLASHFVELANKIEVIYCEEVFDIPLRYKINVKEGDMALVEGPLPKQVLDKIYVKAK